MLAKVPSKQDGLLPMLFCDLQGELLAYFVIAMVVGAEAVYKIGLVT